MQKFTKKQAGIYVAGWFTRPQPLKNIPSPFTVCEKVMRAVKWLEGAGWTVCWLPDMQPIGGVGSDLLPDYTGVVAYNHVSGLWIDLYDTEEENGADRWYLWPMEETYHFGQVRSTVGLMPWCLGHCEMNLEALLDLLVKHQCLSTPL